MPDGHERLAAFRVAVAVVRAATTAAAIGLAVPEASHHNWWVVGWVAVVVAYNVLRLFRPVRDRGDGIGAVALDLEVGLHLVAVIVTGRWASPLAFPLLTSLLLVGFSRGFGWALRTAAVIAVAVGVATLALDPIDATSGRLVLQWSVELLLVGLVAGYVRRISGEASRQQSDTLSRLSQLTDANRLLSSLHGIARSLPASLDLSDTLDTTMTQLREVFAADVSVLLLHDDTNGQWVVTRADGMPKGATYARPDLPAALEHALAIGEVVAVQDLMKNGRGLSSGSHSGVFAPLVARHAMVGLLALEYTDGRAIKREQIELLNGLTAPMGLAIDNARWFERLRIIGAEDERTRIARDLHDRIGQSLAYLAFELDRIIKNQNRGNDIGGALHQLRGDLRGVIGEVRDTLYDLRTDVSETTNMATTMRNYLDRVAERSGMQVSVDAQETHRLPLLQEREMWRIAQEAVTNVERHARAQRVRVRWRSDDHGAELLVEDDGIGFPAGRAGRLDSYGILGMRERAASMGATLDVQSEPGRGTRVSCRLVP